MPDDLAANTSPIELQTTSMVVAGKVHAVCCQRNVTLHVLAVHVDE